jgi:hypothetical protein
MRLIGALNLRFDACPRLSLFFTRRHGGLLALEICEGKGMGVSSRAEVVIFAPPELEAGLSRAVEAFNAALEGRCHVKSPAENRAFELLAETDDAPAPGDQYLATTGAGAPQLKW